MAGGTFNRTAGKVRPGTYINFESSQREPLGLNPRGVVLIPLIGHSYGPVGEFITITSDAPDAALTKLGYSVYDEIPAAMCIREAFKSAHTVIVYIPAKGKKATVTAGSLTATAFYGGARGNDLRVVIAENPVSEGSFDVTILLGTDVVSSYEGLSTIENLIAQNDPWVVFSGTGELTAQSGISLKDGENGSLTPEDFTSFLDASESIRWNTLACPLEPTSEDDIVPGLLAAVKSKIFDLRENAGKYRKAVVANFAGADYEGIINVTNTVELNGEPLPIGIAVCWVAGADAGAANTQSNTHKVYEGATGIIGQKNNAEAVLAINNGEYFFSLSEANEVVVEYDINSLITFDPPKDKTYRKNRVMRVLDSFAEALMTNFPPNRFNNDPTDWDVMDGVGRAVLKQFLDARAIQNVDFTADFSVDRGNSQGDETFFNVGIQAIDSSEKLFFQIKSR